MIRAYALTVLGAVLLVIPSGTAACAAAVTLPPAHAPFDYQIGGGYPPPDGVTVVSRDHDDDPAPGLYNICYVNGFQAQPGTEDEWGDLLLRDGGGNIVYDEDWDEALLDIRTATTRERIADRVNAWVDECADKGFQAIEPDNYDSYTRSQDLLTDDHAQAHIRLLSAHAHQVGLAIGQKNTVELAENRVANGLDFAVAEECGYEEECEGYVDAFGANVIVIEYTEQGLSTACAGWRDQLSIVLRDVEVSTPDSEGYVYRTC
ncbi:endo alpha-1,4 polygalactosaminidase [Actinophytocola sp.]|uniref:endo alpha-1,4 polygalactosaminidase n=1 Tax=Actinophytocola sp. TaxID=1872138 RepID=UPI002ED0BFB7